ncbi:P-loop containing nucleoside triphosphate hydrolase protein [Coniochaeta sp. 2T2.1]|nr:P-loop containing nucleoside triphosphate hydrolase protein [Coniochaeta sp. 2T2.1]
MEEQLTRLVDTVWEKYLQTPHDRRLLVAIGGIPGSGKTTLATTLVTLLNARHASSQASAPPTSSSSQEPTAPLSSPSQGPQLAAYIPMDGYHLTRAQLSAMPDPATAHARRGAEFTFDGEAFLELIKSLRGPDQGQTALVVKEGEDGVIYAPSFDHSIKDPVPDSIPILPLPANKIVVVEGIYVLLDKEPWRTAAGMFDLKVFVKVDRETARRRLVRRHVAAGIVRDEEEGDRRARENDLVNGDLIEELLLEVDVVVESREDGGWVHS